MLGDRSIREAVIEGELDGFSLRLAERFERPTRAIGVVTVGDDRLW